MKLNINEERFLAAIDQAGDHEVGVGYLSNDAIVGEQEQRSFMEATRFEPTQLAFGRLMNLMRRQKVWSMSKLAAEARIDIEEVLQIENDHDFRPEQRTVYQLAQVFSVSPKALMQLSGNAIPRAEVMQEAVRFAAQSEPISRLSDEEAKEVERFVAVLNALVDKKQVPAQ
jgi:HTH-type transcriptional regulator, competence development regulator